MPWGAKKMTEKRGEFIREAKQKKKSFTQLCTEYEISRKTGYKWLRRESQGHGLEDQPRRPHHSVNQIGGEIEKLLLDVRRNHPAWGGKKIRQTLLNEGRTGIPASSTITEVLRRNGFIDEQESLKHRAYQRFEYSAPNELWQADFKGSKGWARQVGCHALTVLDDHSRFSIGLRSCPDERKETVQQEFSLMFRQNGMPLRILTDNGSPWGNGPAVELHTTLSVWLMLLGIRVVHGSPYHPQTQGKDERFNRTLQEEVMRRYRPDDWKGYQPVFDEWRDVYNHIRPHEALDMQVPAKRYVPSPRQFPEKLPDVIYDQGLQLRKTDPLGWICFHSQYWYIGRAFQGYYVAVKQTEIDGVFDVFFMNCCISSIDLRNNRRRP